MRSPSLFIAACTVTPCEALSMDRVTNSASLQSYHSEKCVTKASYILQSLVMASAINRKKRALLVVIEVKVVRLRAH